MGQIEQTKQRCRWVGHDSLLADYHDEEWGVPEYDGRALWEKLVLDGFQAGLSWRTILAKRTAFRRAFAQFEPKAVARFLPGDVERLLANKDIVRSRAKIVATIGNAQAYLAMEARGELFAPFVWRAVKGRTKRPGRYRPRTESAASCRLAAALKLRGFRFVGPTIVYAFMQASGLIDDHEPQCFLAHTQRAGAPPQRPLWLGSLESTGSP